MTRPLTFTLVLSQSAMQAVRDRNQEPEGRCPISDYSREIEAEPNNATAYLARGTAHLKALDFDSAIADFTKAIELNPNDDAAYTNRGGAHYEKAEFYRAVADLNRALQINPKSALAHSNLGWTYEAMHDERNAIVHYRKALEIDPSLQAARDNLKLLGAPLKCEILNWQKAHDLRKDRIRPS
jgi:tetratricopeptide (TPR) repeat protein